MVRTLSWLANGALFVVCCFLAAETANAVFAAALTPSEPDAMPAAPRSELARRGWDDRQVILERNLFQASLLAPSLPEPEPIEEELEETKLPLTLIGTIAAPTPEDSWAAIEDRSSRETKVVRPRDELQRNVSVVQIERRRVVLSENGAMRQLSLDEEEESGVRTADRRPPRRVADRRRERAEDRAARLTRLAEDRFKVSKSDVEEMVRNPATLFSQARILPKYEEGEMIGLQVNAIKSGSLFEEMGLKNGDVITELNGIPIDSPEQSAKILAEFAAATEFSAVVESQGQVREIEFLPEEEE